MDGFCILGGKSIEIMQKCAHADVVDPHTKKESKTPSNISYFALTASSNLLAISSTSASVLHPPRNVTPNGSRCCSSSFPSSASGAVGAWSTYDGALTILLIA